MIKTLFCYLKYDLTRLFTWPYFTILAQGENLKKLGYVVIDGILQFLGGVFAFRRVGKIEPLCLDF